MQLFFIFSMQATERPGYLIKTPEQKFWCIQIETVSLDGDRNVCLHYFSCSKKAERFSAHFNYSCFDKQDFFYSSVEAVEKKRGVKHF